MYVYRAGNSANNCFSDKMIFNFCLDIHVYGYNNELLILFYGPPLEELYFY